MNYSRIKAYSLIPGSDASDKTQNSSYNFLSHIKIQVTRVASFHETLSISGSFQPSLCHGQMWASSSWFRMVAIWVPATRWRKGWWRRNKGHLPATSLGCTQKLPSNTFAYITLVRICSPGKCRNKDLILDDLVPSWRLLLLWKNRRQVCGLKSSSCYTVLNIFWAFFSWSSW